MNTKSLIAAAAITTLVGGATTQAATVVVNDFSPTEGTNLWVLDKTATATASIVDLSGTGGTLESNQPLATGAARLTTTTSSSDYATALTRQDFGAASTVLSSLTLGYDYYKTGGAPAPTAAMKIEVLNPSTHGVGNDNYGQLVYEPYLQGSNPTVGNWEIVSIDSTTGAGNDATGGWWWTGGFNIASSAGGQPYRSLAEWAAAFAAADPTDFAGASVVGIGIGIGSNNPSQDIYFDNVSYQIGDGAVTTYDFQAVPEPTGFALLAAGAACMLLRRRRQQTV